MTWTRDEALAAVKEVLSRPAPWSEGWSFHQAEIDGDFVLVTFRHKRSEHVVGVRYLATDRTSVYTGEPCETATEWAVEIRLDIDEQVGTGDIARAERTMLPNGIELVNWHG